VSITKRFVVGNMVSQGIVVLLLAALLLVPSSACKIFVFAFDDLRFTSRSIDAFSRRAAKDMRDSGGVATEFQNGQEYYIHQALLRSPLRTDDPDEADFIFVANYATYQWSSCPKGVSPEKCQTEEGQATADAIKIVRESPLWKRRGGTDFVFVLGHPYTYAQFYHQIKNSLCLVVDMDKSPLLKNYQIIPYVVTPHVFPAGARLGRETLLYFNGYRSSSPTRSNLLNAYKGIADKDVKVVDKDRANNLLPHSEYVGQLQRSIFCLVVRGDTSSSRRLYEAIVAGCLPVIVSEGIELPFEKHIDYSKFAFTPSEMEVVMNAAGFVKTMRAVTQEEIERRQQAMAAVAHHFVFGETDGKGAEELILTNLCSAPRSETCDADEDDPKAKAAREAKSKKAAAAKANARAARADAARRRKEAEEQAASSE
jgi:hypothetical protein